MSLGVGIVKLSKGNDSFDQSFCFLKFDHLFSLDVLCS